MTIKHLFLVLSATALAAPVSAAPAKPARPAKASGMPSDNDVLRFVCGLIGNKTAEAARQQQQCRAKASLGKGRQRGVRPR
jgi:hypothetical protein